MPSTVAEVTSGVFGERPTAPPLNKGTSYDPKTGWRASDIQAAFKIFDKDGDGTIDKAELFKILTMSGSVSTGLAEADARALIEMFDTNGDGVLDLGEFTRALTDSDLGDAVKESEAFTNDLYDRRAKPFMPAIKALFATLDADGSGLLSVSEVKEVVEFFEGAEFDEATFLKWYDVNHAVELDRLGAMTTAQVAHVGTSDGKLDLTEWSWYIVEAAGCDETKMAGVIDSIREAIDYVASKKKAASA